MDMNVKGMAVAGAALWGGAVLLTATANLVNRRYGRAFLETVASVYPGYHATQSKRDVATGAILAALDGAAAGAMFAVLYNRFARRESLKAHPPAA